MLPMLSDVNAIPTPDRDEIRNRSRRLAGRFSCGPANRMSADTIERVKEKLSGAVICSAVPEIDGNRRLDAVAQPRDLADVNVAIVRALLGVAETGSVLLTEDELVVNTLAYLAQHLVVLLDPDDIVSGLQDAYDRSEFHRAAYAVFHTGPSATGDIEGVLIHGAQAVRTLTVAFIPRRQPGRRAATS
jgi:L-lactate dehydrogenase complex protein LldG